ncbi:hypothetical protein MNB_SUP05-4-381 [hydrothermal vent metagenome]|uniref:Cell division protein DivIC (FtsB), stabilizes FtsL against RasP cleavage n=1 Tax=hydrothermal vent metagenome TaxID=652676 RepID=A0A1W1D802_9ZZZZ
MNIKSHLRPVIGLIKKPNNLFGFFYRHWFSLVLIVILITLFRQNFISNNFPFDIYDKQNLLIQSIADNKQLEQENIQLKLESAAKSDDKLEILESMARQKFGLIKSGERYYQFNISEQNQ